MVAVVTGGASGIGQAICIGLTEAGVICVVGDRAGPVRRVGGASCPVPFAAGLEQAYLVTAPDIEPAARAARS